MTKRSTLALLVVDMQLDLCSDERRASKVREMLPTLRSLLTDLEARQVPRIFTQYWLAPDSEQFVRFGDRYCIEGTPGAEIIPELQESVRKSQAVVRKRHHSAFFETDLHSILLELGCNTLLIAGLQTHICIMTTAADASFRDLRPVVLSDCVVSSDATKKAEALDWIERYVGEVATSDEVIGRLP